MCICPEIANKHIIYADTDFTSMKNIADFRLCVFVAAASNYIFDLLNNIFLM